MDLAPPYLTSVIQKGFDTHPHKTMSTISKNRFVHSIRTEAGKNTFEFSGTKLWNNIPANIKEAATVQQSYISLSFLSILLCKSLDNMHVSLYES